MEVGLASAFPDCSPEQVRPFAASTVPHPPPPHTHTVTIQRGTTNCAVPEESKGREAPGGHPQGPLTASRGSYNRKAPDQVPATWDKITDLPPQPEKYPVHCGVQITDPGVQALTAAHITDKETAPESSFDALPPSFKNNCLCWVFRKIL